MARVSFFDDFFGRGDSLTSGGQNNAGLFDYAICVADLNQGGVTVMSSGTANKPGAGFVRILPYGISTPQNCGGVSVPAYCSIILTSPELVAKKNPLVGASILFRDDYPTDKLHLLVGFTTSGEDGTVAQDRIGFDLVNNTGQSNAINAYYYAGNSLVKSTGTSQKIVLDAPFVLEVRLTAEDCTWVYNGRTLDYLKTTAPTRALNFELLLAINDHTASNINREMLVDYAYGSLDR